MTDSGGFETVGSKIMASKAKTNLRRLLSKASKVNTSVYELKKALQLNVPNAVNVQNPLKDWKIRTEVSESTLFSHKET